MKVVFVHGFAGVLSDARAKGILGRDLEFYVECVRQGIDPVVATLDLEECAELAGAGLRHVPLRGVGGVAGARSRLRAVVSLEAPAAVVGDVTAAPVLLWTRWRVPVLARYEWYWSRVSTTEDSWREQMLKRLLEGRVIRRSTGVIAATAALASDARARGARRVWMAPVFVARPFFEAGERAGSGAGGPPRFLCVGRQVAVKRFDVAVSALADVVLPQGSVLDVVGSGPEAGRIRDLAERAGVPLVQHEVVANDVLPGYFERSTALLHPSLNEGMPRVVLEAFASGLPVFAGRSPGTEEVVGVRGERGVLVGDSVSEWTKAISEALAEGFLRERWTPVTERARGWATSHVSVEASVSAHVAAIREVSG